MAYSRYYLALVTKEKAWLVSGCIRNLGHVALERALVPKDNLFEFFVAPQFAIEFESIMADLIKKKAIIWCKESPNRFLN